MGRFVEGADRSRLTLFAGMLGRLGRRGQRGPCDRCVCGSPRFAWDGLWFEAVAQQADEKDGHCNHAAIMLRFAADRESRGRSFRKRQGNVRLSPEASAYFEKKDCRVMVEPTPEAIRSFNEHGQKRSASCTSRVDLALECNGGNQAPPKGSARYP
jgi:hypothetical protein